MHRNSHILIGSYVLHTYFPNIRPGLQKAFMLGCVYPDKNPFTYLKGSLRYQSFRGHNWDNAQKCIQKLCKRLETGEKINFRSVYTLGLLLHYTCDAFTYAHNSIFRQGLKHHRLYESQLHRVLKRQYASAPVIMPTGELWQRIQASHSAYIAQLCGTATDAAFIWHAVHLVCSAYWEKQKKRISITGKINKICDEICPFCTCKMEYTVL